MNYEAKHLFFDLDDTLTVNKMVMEDDMYELLLSLPYTKIIVSGATVPQILNQTRSLPLYKLGQNGNHAVDTENVLLWKEHLLSHEIEAIQDHIQLVKKHVSEFLDVHTMRSSCIDGQIVFNLINPDTERTVKNIFDPSRELRKKILSEVPCTHNDVEVKVSGATSLDYVRKGNNKGFYVKKLIDRMGWDKNECLYFGDSFYPGGNDESVQGVIETVSVSNHRETFEHLLCFKQ